MSYENLRGKLGETFGFKLNDRGEVLDRKKVFSCLVMQETLLLNVERHLIRSM